jgi:hypothetical protein
MARFLEALNDLEIDLQANSWSEKLFISRILRASRRYRVEDRKTELLGEHLSWRRRSERRLPALGRSSCSCGKMSSAPGQGPFGKSKPAYSGERCSGRAKSQLKDLAIQLKAN